MFAIILILIIHNLMTADQLDFQEPFGWKNQPSKFCAVQLNLNFSPVSSGHEKFPVSEKSWLEMSVQPTRIFRSISHPFPFSVYIIS